MDRDKALNILRIGVIICLLVFGAYWFGGDTANKRMVAVRDFKTVYPEAHIIQIQPNIYGTSLYIIAFSEDERGTWTYRGSYKINNGTVESRRLSRDFLMNLKTDSLNLYKSYYGVD